MAASSQRSEAGAKCPESTAAGVPSCPRHAYGFEGLRSQLSFPPASTFCNEFAAARLEPHWGCDGAGEKRAEARGLHHRPQPLEPGLAGDGPGLGALWPAPPAGLTIWEYTCLPRKLGGK